MTREEFKKEFGDQILRDISNISELRDEMSIAANKAKKSVFDDYAKKRYLGICNAHQRDIKDIYDAVANLAVAYLHIDDKAQAYDTAVEIATDGLSKVSTIKEIRERTGLSQERFAAKYEIPRRTLENWESGTNKAPDYLIKLLARVVWSDFPIAQS